MAYPKSTIPMIGVIMYKDLPLPSHVCGYETIDMGINFDISGGQGGGVNYPRDVVRSSPKTGLSWMNDSFVTAMVKLFSTLWFFSLRDV